MQPTIIDLSTARPYLSLVLTALIVMGSPGPANIGATASATAFGLRRSLPYLVGSILGTTVVLIAVAVGLASILLATPRLGPALLALSVGYLIYLAYKIATAQPLAVHEARAQAPAWTSGFIVAVANPKAYAALGTVFTGTTLDLPTEALETLVKALILAVLVVLIHLGWAVAGASFSAALRRPRISRILNLVLAAALLASTIPALTEHLTCVAIAPRDVNLDRSRRNAHRRSYFFLPQIEPVTKHQRLPLPSRKRPDGFHDRPLVIAEYHLVLS